MLKGIAIYGLVSVLGIAALLTVVGAVMKKLGKGRIAPGVTVCGRDISGMTPEEAAEVIRDLVPVCVTEIRCRFLPEMGEKIQVQVRERNEKIKQESGLRGREGAETISLIMLEKEVILVMRQPILGVDEEETLQAVMKKSGEVKVWEWMYGAVARRPFRIRKAEASLRWDEVCLGEGVAMLRSLTERDRQNATVDWEKGQVRVTESRRGFRLDTEALWSDAERVITEAEEIFRSSVCATRRACLDILSAACDREICDKRVLGLSGAV